MSRLEDIKIFYDLLNKLEEKIGGKQQLNTKSKPKLLPEKGVYFFFEKNEVRTDSGDGLRVVRIGTHTTTRTSKTTLWNRLKQHQGTFKGKRPGGGSHRGSIFRIHVGKAILLKEGKILQSWGIGKGWRDAIKIKWFDLDNLSDKELKNIRDQLLDDEYPIEKKVSSTIRNMWYVWVKVDDPPSNRSYLEKNTIALLSNYDRSPIDPPSPKWLGNYSPSEQIRKSGLWNIQHVNEKHNPNFLTILEKYINKTMGKNN